MKGLPWQDHVFIIAEAGVNHNGDVRLAKRLIDAAAEAKADVVKFQTWKDGEIIGRFSKKVDYLEKSTGKRQSMEDLAKQLCLPYEAFRELQRYASTRGILFLSTPDGFTSLDFLADELRLPIIKIGSTEVTHVQFLAAAARKKRPIILSTGLSTLADVKKAVSAIREAAEVPLALLHCTSEYPAPANEMNLRAIQTLAGKFHTPVGLSDHSTGSEAAVAAVALGAVIIEKHFTLDKKMRGPDHKASVDPDELAALVRSIRTAETMLGDGVKRRTPAEERNVGEIRRSVVAAHPIQAGKRLLRRDLVCKRPGTGVAPEFLDRLVGKRVIKPLEEDEPLRWEYLK